MIKKHHLPKQCLTELIRVETGLDLQGLKDESLNRLTYKITEKGKKTPFINANMKLKGYCDWLPHLIENGGIPSDCKKFLGDIYTHLSKKDQNYIDEQIEMIRNQEYSLKENNLERQLAAI